MSSPERLTAEDLAAWRAFLEAHAAVTHVLAVELQDAVGLPLSWYDVLVQLSEAPGRQLRMHDLAEAVLLSKSGLTRLVQRMEDEGLVQRERCDLDRRGTWARLTEAGHDRLVEAAPTHVEGVARHFADRLDDDEVAVLHRALTVVAKHARAAVGG